MLSNDCGVPDVMIMDAAVHQEPTAMRMLTVRLVPRASYVPGAGEPVEPKGAVRLEVPYSMTAGELAAELVRETSAPTVTTRVRSLFGMNAYRNDEAMSARASAMQLYVEDCGGDAAALVPVPRLTRLEALTSLAANTHAPDGPELTMYCTQEDSFGCCCLLCAACCAAGAATGMAVSSNNKKKQNQAARPNTKPTPKPHTTTTTHTTNNYHNQGGNYPSEAQYVNNTGVNQPQAGNYPSEPAYYANYGQPQTQTYNNYPMENHDPYKADVGHGQQGGNYAPNSYGLPPTQVAPAQGAPVQGNVVTYGNATSTPAPL